MTYTFRPRGVCSQQMQVDVDEQGVIQELRVLGGCSGNLQGIAALVKGMSAEEAVRRLRVEKMPLTVILDTQGGDLYQSGPAAYLASLGSSQG